MAPFLSGPRYSSFGRHFTKLEKLKEVIQFVVLHSTVRDNLGGILASFVWTALIHYKCLVTIT